MASALRSGGCSRLSDGLIGLLVPRRQCNPVAQRKKHGRRDWGTATDGGTRVRRLEAQLASFRMRNTTPGNANGAVANVRRPLGLSSVVQRLQMGRAILAAILWTDGTVPSTCRWQAVSLRHGNASRENGPYVCTNSRRRPQSRDEARDERGRHRCSAPLGQSERRAALAGVVASLPLKTGLRRRNYMTQVWQPPV